MSLNIYDSMSTSAKIVITVAIMLFLGFLATRITKKLKLPNVTAYIVVGILIGPFCFNLVPIEVVDGMDFLNDISLAFIAFNMGEFFRVKLLKELGIKVLLVSLIETFVVFAIVFVLMYFAVGISLTLSVILAGLAGATGPTTTVMTIRQKQAKGPFVNTLLLVIAFDDILSLLVFSIASSLAGIGSNANFMSVLVPILTNIAVLGLGLVFGFLLKLLMPKTRTNDNRLIISIAVLFLFCGICALLNISPLLGCMSMGLMYINLTNDEKLFNQLSYFSPPILLLFFVNSGINLDIESLFSSSSYGAVPLIVYGLLFIVIRDVAKYVGAYAGSAATKQEKNIRNYVGLALMPQGGFVLGLAALGMRTLDTTEGNILSSIAMCAVVINEIIGPALASLSLSLSKSYQTDLDDLTNVDVVDAEGNKKNQVEILIEQINEIKKTMPAHEENIEEEAFNEGSMEQYVSLNENYKMRKWRRR